MLSCFIENGSSFVEKENLLKDKYRKQQVAQNEGVAQNGRRTNPVKYKYYAILLLSISLLSLILFHNCLKGDFVHDDIPAIVRNRDVTGKQPITDLLYNDYWGSHISSKESHKSYRPLTVLSFR